MLATVYSQKQPVILWSLLFILYTPQPNLASLNFTSKYISFTLDSVFQPLKMYLVPFLMSFSLSWCFQISKFLNSTLLVAFWLLKAIRSYCLLHFNLEINQLCFACCFLISKYLVVLVNTDFNL